MEYAGYIKRKPTDWSKIARETTERLGTIEEGREKKREELDTLYQDTKKAIREVELGQNETTNQAVLKGAQEARDEIYSDYKALRAGDLSPRAFRTLSNNRQDSWGELNTAMKQYNARVSEVNKMEDDGTASESMLYDNAQIALRMGNDGYEWKWSDDGTLVSAKIDAKGNIVPNTILPVSSLNKTQNVLSKRFDLKKAVGLDKIGKFKKVVGDMMVKGYDVIPEVDKFNATVTKSILTSDDIIGKVLTDASTDPYFYYTTDEELADKIAAGGKKEFGVKKKLGRDGGMVAVPSPTQKTAAEKVITDWVKYEIGVEETPITKKTDPGLDKKTERLDASYDAYLRANEVLNGKNLNDIIGNKVGGPGGKTIVNAYTTPEGTVVVVKGAGQKAQAKTLPPITSAEGAMKFVSSGGKSAKGTQSELDHQYNEGKAEYEKREGKLKMEKEVPEEVDDILPISGLKDGTDKQKVEYNRVIKEYRKLQDKQLSKENDRTSVQNVIKKEIIASLNSRYIDITEDQIKIVFTKSNLGNYDGATVQVGGGAPQDIELDFAFDANQEDAEKMDDGITDAINSYIGVYNKTLTSGGGTKKTVPELKKENPNLTNAEIIKLFKDQ